MSVSTFWSHWHTFYTQCSGLRENEGSNEDSSAVIIVDGSAGAPAVEGIKAPFVTNTPTL